MGYSVTLRFELIVEFKSDCLDIRLIRCVYQNAVMTISLLIVNMTSPTFHSDHSF